jgi:uncharacterized protein YdbL (DUF1318 family)
MRCDTKERLVEAYLQAFERYTESLDALKSVIAARPEDYKQALEKSELARDACESVRAAAVAHYTEHGC